MSLGFMGLRKYSQLLKNRDIKKILNEELKNYKITKIDKNSGTALLYNDNNGQSKQMFFENSNIILVGKKDNKVNITTIKEGPELEVYAYDFRIGVILEKTNIKYGYSNYSKDYKVPTSLISKRYVLYEKSTLGLRGSDLDDIYNRHIEFISNNSLQNSSFFYTTFESFMVNKDLIPNFRGSIDTLYSTHTFVNDRDISYIYDIVKGPDKLLRIFDLYRGIINERNKQDIKGINQGLIKSDAFAYLELKGIKQKEDSFVSKEKFDADYIRNVSNIISEVTGNINYIDSLERDSLISSIKYVPKASEIAKRDVEKVVGMSYNEFDMLNIEEQNSGYSKKKNKEYHKKDRNIN